MIHYSDPPILLRDVIEDIGDVVRLLERGLELSGVDQGRRVGRLDEETAPLQQLRQRAPAGGDARRAAGGRMTPAVELKSLGFTPIPDGDGYRRRGTSFEMSGHWGQLDSTFRNGAQRAGESSSSAR